MKNILQSNIESPHGKIQCRTNCEIDVLRLVDLRRDLIIHFFLSTNLCFSLLIIYLVVCFYFLFHSYDMTDMDKTNMCVYYVH